ncbi:hypothetical protein [Dyadobacter sp. BHUBP1]|uniref:hypothetical protein n=1 Tax=Dyadobacter sp. BHUBP1 TaxID=3424178 RepID=UPI003D32D4BA
MRSELVHYLDLREPTRVLLASLIEAGNKQIKQFGERDAYLALDINGCFNASELKFNDGCIALAELYQNNLVSPVDDRPEVNLLIKNVVKWIEHEIAAKEARVSNDLREVEAMVLSLELAA